LRGGKICIIGCNRTGLLTAVILSGCGHKVQLADADEALLSKISKGELPFYDQGITTVISKSILTRKIILTSAIKKAVASSDFVFISAPTEVLKSGATNLSRVKEAAEIVGTSLSRGKTIIVSSIVPPGSTEAIIAGIIEKKSDLEPGKGFFLTVCRICFDENEAAYGRIVPKRIVVGAVRKKTGENIMSLFNCCETKKIITDIKTAEAVEYLEGCLRATSVSSLNEIANLCEAFGIDAQETLGIAGVNNRSLIGFGYGDSNIVSEVSSIIHQGEQLNERLELLRAVRKINDRRPLKAIELLKNEIGNLRGKKIALLGLATASSGADVDRSKAFDIAVAMLAQGAKVIGYDPIAMSSFIKLLPGISYTATAREALQGVDGCIIQTDDAEFSKLTKQDFDLMKTKTVIDARRILSPAKMEKFGVVYRAVGSGKRHVKEE